MASIVYKGSENINFQLEIFYVHKINLLHQRWSSVNNFIEIMFLIVITCTVLYII